MDKIYLIALMAVLTWPIGAAGEIYRWVDDAGVVHYSDSPHEGSTRVILPEATTYKDTNPVPQKVERAVSTGGDNDENAGADKPRVRIVSPSPEQTFRNTQNQVTVATEVTPALAANQRLVFYLDGTPVPPSPTASTTIQLQNVERGAHTVTAAVVGPNGQEISRSEGVLFHYKQASAINPAAAAPGRTAPRPLVPNTP